MPDTALAAGDRVVYKVDILLPSHDLTFSRGMQSVALPILVIKIVDGSHRGVSSPQLFLSGCPLEDQFWNVCSLSRPALVSCSAGYVICSFICVFIHSAHVYSTPCGLPGKMLESCDEQSRPNTCCEGASSLAGNTFVNQKEKV